MTGPSSGDRAHDPTSFTLTVSEDPRLLDAVLDTILRAAEASGCEAAQAVRLRDDVRRVLELLLAAAQPARPQEAYEVRFDVEPQGLRVEIACETPSLQDQMGLLAGVEARRIGRQQIFRLVCGPTSRA
jgi:hypothetical protein